MPRSCWRELRSGPATFEAANEQLQALQVQYPLISYRDTWSAGSGRVHPRIDPRGTARSASSRTVCRRG